MDMKIEILSGLVLFVLLAVYLIIVAIISRNENKKMEKRLSEFSVRREEVRRELRNRF
ncbi:hypothetical protein LRM33_15625 [Klebsiella pneumoniae]|uniref:hypothetical protein n=1 Tax=Klebsiella pneumoniae TaxID=573 RepID=UPI001F4C933A|nr:hypothetical protein [Klebsiella pneumoniae]UNE90676.1 hypothetical protein LRM33_15625 [Klebsiella pneumoniae]UNE96309.1 hypothetical protein LRM34_15615 [Klebsiella pneumoniae]WQN87258.1 hypothetical protein U8Q79_15660 [Klebsiella pneumoniae]WQN92856.1 hypothetical protein U8Q78_15655 [Klebsiella pneumoniae]